MVAFLLSVFRCLFISIFSKRFMHEPSLVSLVHISPMNWVVVFSAAGDALFGSIFLAFESFCTLCSVLLAFTWHFICFNFPNNALKNPVVRYSVNLDGPPAAVPLVYEDISPHYLSGNMRTAIIQCGTLKLSFLLAPRMTIVLLHVYILNFPFLWNSQGISQCRSFWPRAGSFDTCVVIKTELSSKQEIFLGSSKRYLFHHFLPSF